MKKLLKIIGGLIAFFILAFLAFLGFTIFTDYKPEATLDLAIDTGTTSSEINTNIPYTIVTFNTGYGGLGETQDFFMDGGEGSGADSLEEVETNTDFIANYLDNMEADFVLLQEVDIDSKRSFSINQYESYLPEYHRTFAPNYINRFVPVPLTSPLGKVESGLVTASKSLPTAATRYVFEGEESFFVQLFDLDRAFTVSRYPVGEHQLVVINAHFSAYDKGGQIRKQQLNQIKNILLHEYNIGNYVILGGDFNHELPGTDSTIFSYTQDYPDWIQPLPETFNIEGYRFAIDPNVPTVRDLMFPYKNGENFVAVIDGYYISNNIEVLETRTDNLEFKYSDHNPVILRFILR